MEVGQLIHIDKGIANTPILNQPLAYVQTSPHLRITHLQIMIYRHDDTGYQQTGEHTRPPGAYWTGPNTWHDCSHQLSKKIAYTSALSASRLEHTHTDACSSSTYPTYSSWPIFHTGNLFHWSFCITNQNSHLPSWWGIHIHRCHLVQFMHAYLQSHR